MTDPAPSDAAASAPPEVVVPLADADATRAFGEAIGARCREGDVVALCGPLGAGKTTFVQGFARGLAVADRVRSPTFALCHEYAGRHPVLHIDLYRVAAPEEAEDLGFADRVGVDGVAVVEWADLHPSLIPEHALWVRLTYAGDARSATATGATELVPVATSPI